MRQRPASANRRVFARALREWHSGVGRRPYHEFATTLFADLATTQLTDFVTALNRVLAQLRDAVPPDPATPLSMTGSVRHPLFASAFDRVSPLWNASSARAATSCAPDSPAASWRSAPATVPTSRTTPKPRPN